MHLQYSVEKPVGVFASLPDPSAPLILFSPPWALTKGFALVAHEMLASPPLPFPCHVPR